MSELQRGLKLNDQEVAAEVIDGEAIIIRFSDSVYFSLNNVGGLFWELMSSGKRLEAIAAAIAARYEVSLEEARADLAKLAGELEKERLVMPSDDIDESAISSEVGEAAKLPYEAPSLNIYRDMGDLLALDPPAPGLAEIQWKEAEEGNA